MDFRRSGQLDGRRRRALSGDRTSTAAADDAADTPPPSSTKAPVRAYAPAVLAERQPAISELIPRRGFAIVMLPLLGLTAIATIQCLYIHAHGKLPAALAAIDITQRGNLADWFSSALLLLAAATALVILSIRIHRIDDYRGRYRVWRWAAGALVLASIDTATHLHVAVNFGLQWASGLPTEGIGAHLWLITYGVVFGGLAVRLLWEIGASLESLAMLLLTAACYGGGVALEVNAVEIVSPLLKSVLVSTLTLVAHGGLVYTLALYARHVYLDASGRLLVNARPKKRKPRARTKLSVVSTDADEAPKKKAAAKPTDGKTTDAKDDAAKPAAAKSATGSVGAAISSATLTKPQSGGKSSASDDDDEDDSKSDRKQLKKLVRQESQQQRRAA